MLTQEAWMDLKVLSRQGLSMRAIARLTGYSRVAIRRVLETVRKVTVWLHGGPSNVSWWHTPGLHSSHIIAHSL